MPRGNAGDFVDLCLDDHRNAQVAVSETNQALRTQLSSEQGLLEHLEAKLSDAMVRRP